jgi:hypothetical protein
VEEEDALGELMELVKSLSAKIERLESEQSAEDSPVLETDVLDSPTNGDSIEYFITVEALRSSPNVLSHSYLNEEIMVYSDEEQQFPTSHLDVLGSIHPVYDNYESVSELDLQDSQEHTTNSYPLFTNEKCCEEISHPGPTEDTKQHFEEQRFPTVLVYDYYESYPWERREE